MEFQDLPNEVQLLIFDRMNVRTRLTASLVCHQWNRLAFTAKFMQRLQVTLEIRQSQCLTAAINLLARSERSYAKLKLTYQGNSQQNLDTLRELLKSMNALKELELLFFFYCFREKLNIVIYELLTSCPALRTISIGIRGRLMSWIGNPPPNNLSGVIDLVDEPLSFPSLTSMTIKRNPDLLHPRFYDVAQPLSSPIFYVPPDAESVPNLRHLTMNCESADHLQLFAKLAEQLETISVVSFDSHCRQVEPFLNLQLPQARSLKLAQIRLPFFEELCQFIRGLRKIQTLEMEMVLINSEVVDVILENCIDLKQLGLHMESLSSGCLREITRLQKLENLCVSGKTLGGWEPHENYYMGSVGKHLRLKSLTIRFFCFTSSDFISCMAQMMPNLKELHFEDCRAKANILGPVSVHFPELACLEFVKVTHTGVKPQWQLVSAKFFNCAWVNGDFLNKLVEQCSGLKRLNISGCGTSRDALQKISQSVPRGCFVERT